MYNAKIMDHFQNPRNTGELPDANGVGSYGSPNTGDVTRIYLKIVDGRIADIRMQTFGSAVAIASSSMATELVKGKSVDEAEAITREAVSDALDGIPADKMQCSNLAPDAIKAAIADYRKRLGTASG